jgi:hypothetical protein
MHCTIDNRLMVHISPMMTTTAEAEIDGGIHRPLTSASAGDSSTTGNWITATHLVAAVPTPVDVNCSRSQAANFLEQLTSKRFKLPRYVPRLLLPQKMSSRTSQEGWNDHFFR